MELEQFAEKVRQQAHRIMVVAMMNDNKRAAELAAVLCSEAATIANQRQMQQEVSDPERYDLSSLTPPSTTNKPE